MKVQMIRGGALDELGSSLSNYVRRIGNYVRREVRSKSPFLTDYKVCMAFENLGENCEVGLLQRHFGAEPLGLLRFSSIEMLDLIAAVREGFAGVGDEGQTRLVTCPTNGEYRSLDDRYKINSHGLMFSADTSPEAAQAAICRRAKFLRVKFLRDLEEGSKIFVFKTGQDAPTALVLKLCTALRQHGPATLLYVRASPDANLHGGVRWLSDGLMEGYLDRVCNTDGDWDISHAMWIKLLRRALKLSRHRRAMIAAPAPGLAASTS